MSVPDMAKRGVMGVLLAALLVSTGGCAAVLVGGAAAGTGVAYSMGDLETVESASLDRTWAAVEGAIQDLQFTPVSPRKDALEARMEAATANNRTVKINLKRLSENSTQLSIRVGTFGNEALSRQIHDRIRARL